MAIHRPAGILQSTYETLAECARQHFDGSLRGRLVLTTGLGAMGAAQPLAVTFLEGVALVVEIDEERVDRRIASGYLDRKAHAIEEALALCDEALAAGRPLSVGLVGNAADVLPALVQRGLRPDVVTDQTSAHDPGSDTHPSGTRWPSWRALARRIPSGSSAMRFSQSQATSARWSTSRTLARWCSSTGTRFASRRSVQASRGRRTSRASSRCSSARTSASRAGRCGGLRCPAIQPTCGRSTTRCYQHFAGDPSVVNWITIAKDRVPLQGLPARTSWLDHDQRLEFGTMVNQMVASGALSAPVAMSRDHLDSGSVAQPTRETESMADGSDPIADWPVLNALLNCAGGADLVALHQGGGSGMGGSISAGFTLVIDGTGAAQERIDRVLRTDPGIGVIRHADAGYETSIALVREGGLTAPMLAIDQPAR